MLTPLNRLVVEVIGVGNRVRRRDRVPEESNAAGDGHQVVRDVQVFIEPHVAVAKQQVHVQVGRQIRLVASMSLDAMEQCSRDSTLVVPDTRPGDEVR